MTRSTSYPGNQARAAGSQYRVSTAGSNSGDLTAAQQANTVLVALLQMLLSKETSGPEDEADMQALEALAKSTEVAGKLEGNAPPEDGYTAVAKLAWGLLLADHAPPNLRGMASPLLQAAAR